MGVLIEGNGTHFIAELVKLMAGSYFIDSLRPKHLRQDAQGKMVKELPVSNSISDAAT